MDFFFEITILRNIEIFFSKNSNFYFVYLTPVSPQLGLASANFLLISGVVDRKIFRTYYGASMVFTVKILERKNANCRKLFIFW